MKEEKTKFKCDQEGCKKTITVVSNTGFPYEKGWFYLNQIKGKVLESYAPGIDCSIAHFKGRDLHYCSEVCMINGIKQLIEQGKKEKDQEDKRCLSESF